MKKILIIIVIPALMFSFTACSKNSDNEIEAQGSIEEVTIIDEPEKPVETAAPIIPEETLSIHLKVSTAQSIIPADLSAHDLVARMGVGWNLGNTFDAYSSSSSAGGRLTGDITAIETAWVGQGNETTQSLIQTIKSFGFDTIRIPVTWHKVADPDDNWKIREDWLERLKTVVDWIMEEDMFVIINSHHDDNYYLLAEGDATLDEHEGRQFVLNIWSQVVSVFNDDYDEKLIFEALNEPRTRGVSHEWWGEVPQSELDNLNILCQVFVDTVRASGGNNQHRVLMIPTYAASIRPHSLNGFVIPGDPLNSVNKIIMSVHTYAPFEWAHNGKDTYKGASSMQWDFSSIEQAAQRLDIPVILGEWASIATATGSADQELRDSQRVEHAEDFVREASRRGFVCIWWDNGGFNEGDHSFGIIRRDYPHEVNDISQEIISAIMRGLEQ